MASSKNILFLITGTFLFLGCPDPVEDPDPPVAPIWVEKSQPESFSEKGIDAESRNRIVLMWHPNEEIDLAGYTIYRADNTLENDFVKRFKIDLIQNIGADTAFYDDSVSNYVDYYYFITAFDNAGNESNESDTLTYMLLNSPRLESPVNENISSHFTFQWMDLATHFTYTSEYVIRMEYFENGKYIPYWICRFLNQWYGYENTDPIPFDYFPRNSGSIPLNVLEVGGSEEYPQNGSYRWKIKAISEVDNATNLDEASGESDWGFFEIQ